MKKLLLITFAVFMLAIPANAKKAQLARALWFLLERQDDLEKQPNDSVIVTFNVIHAHGYPNEPKFDSRPTPHFVVTIKNNSEHTAYIDLQQSFIIINEELYPLYVPTSEVQTTSNTSMVGVNLGLVGVGSAGTTANTKIVHAEQYVLVPGLTKKTIDVPLTKWDVSMRLSGVDGEIFVRPGNGISNTKSRDYNPPYSLINQTFIKRGEVLDYTDDNNPLTLDMRLCYSFSQDMSPKYTTRSVYYTKHIVGSDYNKGGGFSITTSKERALKTYPELDSYNAAPQKLQFHLWVPYPGFL